MFKEVIWIVGKWNGIFCRNRIYFNDGFVANLIPQKAQALNAFFHDRYFVKEKILGYCFFLNYFLYIQKMSVFLRNKNLYSITVAAQK